MQRAKELEKGRRDSSLPANITLQQRTRKLLYCASTGIPTALILDIMSSGQHGACAVIGLVIGGTAYYFEEEIHTVLGPALRMLADVWNHFNRKPRPGQAIHPLLSRDFWLTGQAPAPDVHESDDQTVESALVDFPEEIVDARFVRPSAEDTNGVARLTIDEIVTHTERNSYHIWIGRSLTRDGNPGVIINIYKQHFKFVGTSQRGKSSMAAAFMDIVTSTHDIHHVRLILLDRENRTSNLFADRPHVLSMKKPDGRQVKLHARNDETVLEYLIHCVAILKHRASLSVETVASLPIILVYIEEFLALKDYFRLKIRQAKTADAKKEAESDFATLVYCMSEIARVGLKYRMQLLLCAQVDYADDDFKEALINVQCGFAFCLRPKAAEAAGFMQTHLVRQNAKEDKPGQAVVETPDCKDLVLAPHYPLEELLLALEKVHPEFFVVSGSQEIPDLSDFEHEIAQHITGTGNTGNAGEQPEKSFPDTGNSGERFQKSGNAGEQQFSPEQVQEVIKAYHDLMRNSDGKKVTRRQLHERLGWSSRRYSDELKPLCDLYGILMDKEGA